MRKRWSSGAPVHVLQCFSTAAAAASGAASFCTYTYTNFLLHFPFDEIYLSASYPLSAFLMLLLLLPLLLLVVLLASVRVVYKIFCFIFRLMRYTDVCYFSLSGVLFPRE